MKTYLANETDVVWVLRGPEGAPLDYPDTPTTDMVFDEFHNEFGPTLAVLGPNRNVTIDIPPTEVTWTADLSYSAAWQMMQIVSDEFEDWVQGKIVDRLRVNSQRRAAMAACGFALKAHLDTRSEWNEMDVAEATVSVLNGYVGGAECVNEVASIRSANAPPLVDDLRALKPSTPKVSRVGKIVSYVQHLGKPVITVLTTVK
ncbi:MAG: hypothetical protein ACRDWY_15260 [Actinomycetes bacterium]